MKEETYPDVRTAAERAAKYIAGLGRQAIQERGRFLLATSGGRTPWRMLGMLAEQELDWGSVHLFQVDERVAPDDNRDRNLTRLKTSLLEKLPSSPAGVWIMPVRDEDLDQAAENYATVLRSVAGDSPVLDLIHLGLGNDGHTASLVPGDEVLDVDDADVAVTATYKRRRRMTLTFPLINRARQILFVVTGASKGPALSQLRRGNKSIPAGRIRRQNTLVVSDQAAYEASLKASKTKAPKA
jgi:6-phosphogluconolactonase